MTTETKYPATWVMHWATGPVPACDKHASALRGLGAALGSHVAMEFAPDGAECANCKNEAEKAARSSQ